MYIYIVNIFIVNVKTVDIIMFNTDEYIAWIWLKLYVTVQKNILFWTIWKELKTKSKDPIDLFKS